ncbi:unnamed protein product [Linum trigynum]|uniref:Uncharacterized protein n=1 Tax=Linum trigynum TaxID=586398 RepID=A0AAV2F642_9ROSI
MLLCEGLFFGGFHVVPLNHSHIPFLSFGKPRGPIAFFEGSGAEFFNRLYRHREGPLFLFMMSFLLARALDLKRFSRSLQVDALVLRRPFRLLPGKVLPDRRAAGVGVLVFFLRWAQIRDLKDLDFRLVWAGHQNGWERLRLMFTGWFRRWARLGVARELILGFARMKLC